jgi:hypothetical protein
VPAQHEQVVAGDTREQGSARRVVERPGEIDAVHFGAERRVEGTNLDRDRHGDIMI